MEVNDQIKKLAPYVPDLKGQIERYADCTHFMETDGMDAYNTVELDVKSRNVLALRTPIGIIRPTRLVEGMRNSGTIYQQRMSRTMAKIPQDSKCHVSNYMDEVSS